MFNVHYLADAKEFFGQNYDKAQEEKLGEIVSYQEYPQGHKPDEPPRGCKALTFATVPANFFNKDTNLVMMKVVKGKLVYIQEPPEPIAQGE